MNSFSIHTYFKRTLLVYGDRLLTVAIGFLSVWLLANFLGPAEYGVYAFLLDFLATGTLLLGINAFAESLIVFIAKERNLSLAHVLLTTGLVLGLFFSGVIFFFPSFVLSLVNQGSPELIKALSLVVFFNITEFLLINALTGSQHFGKILKMSFLENTFNIVFLGIFLFHFQLGVMGAVYAKTISLLVSSVVGYWFFRHVGLLKKNIVWKPVLKFTGYSLLLGFMKRFSAQTLLFFMGLLISPVKLGFYYLIQKISTYLIDMPVNAFNTVLLPTAAEQNQDIEQVEKFVSMSTKFYVILSFAFAAAFLVFGPLFVTIFFPEFLPAIELVPLFAIYFALTFDIPLGTFYRAIMRNEVLVQANLIGLVIMVVAGYWAIQSFGLEGVVGLMVITRTVQLIYLYWDVRRHQYKIEFWPRLHDIIFFWNSAKRVIWNKKK
ncbi:MAG: oligosaccharide flippase family protein [Candidatus Diapherotrites archaeon]|uniref:Oligosaccharide flippase family protein n=1 Tax=Candidatus Iainarchaeum sp. TaxID=3101447 RepID=A0A8T4L4B9_9ARCH|nr:oligosaccharide flippase family protein [Candidatus Diapherotrites archaeon]